MIGIARKIISFCLFLYLAVLANTVLAWYGNVVKVSDGDTITVLRGFQQVRIRFYGIDAPEKGQAYGKAAKRHLIFLVANRNVEIEPVTQDRYGRTVALVFADDTNINQKMVEDGYAWVYRRYCKKSFCSQWLKLEREARKQKLGLWSDSRPVPPWEWRPGKKGKIRKLTSNSPYSGHFGPCGTKRYCKQMRSCEEAYYFLKQCGLSRLDRDGDGVPCEALCR